MTDLRERFNQYRQLEVPDLWDRIETLAAATSVLQPPPARRRRPLVVAAAAFVSVLLVGLTLYLLRSGAEPVPPAEDRATTTSSPTTTPATTAVPVTPTVSSYPEFAAMSMEDRYDFSYETIAGAAGLGPGMRLSPLAGEHPDGRPFSSDDLIGNGRPAVVLVWAVLPGDGTGDLDATTRLHLDALEAAQSEPGFDFVSVVTGDSDRGIASAAIDAAGYTFVPVYAADREPWGVPAALLPAWILLDDKGQFISGFTARVNPSLEGSLDRLAEIGSPLPVSSLLGESGGKAVWDPLPPDVPWQSSTSLNPVISVTATEDGWYVQDAAMCGDDLGWLALRHYLAPPPSEVSIGPMRGDFVLTDTAASLELDFVNPETSVLELAGYPAVLITGDHRRRVGLPGVRSFPGQGDVVALYLVDTDGGLLFVIATADADTYEEFAARAGPLIESIEIDSDDPWGECK